MMRLIGNNVVVYNESESLNVPTCVVMCVCVLPLVITKGVVKPEVYKVYVTRLHHDRTVDPQLTSALYLGLGPTSWPRLNPLSTLSDILMLLNYVLNPILYVLMRQRRRLSLTNLCHSIAHCFKRVWPPYFPIAMTPMSLRFPSWKQLG